MPGFLDRARRGLGIGLCQRRGGPIEAIRPGGRVFFEPGEEHWHGAAPDRFMTHLAMLEVDDEGNHATWEEHVTDEGYNAAPAPSHLVPPDSMPSGTLR